MKSGINLLLENEYPKEYPLVLMQGLPATARIPKKWSSVVVFSTYNAVDDRKEKIDVDAMVFVNRYFNKYDESNPLSDYPKQSLNAYVYYASQDKAICNPFLLESFANKYVFIKQEEKPVTTLSNKFKPNPKDDYAGEYWNGKRKASWKDIVDIANNPISTMLDSYICKSNKALCYAILLHYFRAGYIIKKCEKCGRYFIPTNANSKYCELPRPENKTCKELSIGQSMAKSQSSEAVKTNHDIMDYITKRIRRDIALYGEDSAHVKKLKKTKAEYVKNRDFYKDGVYEDYIQFLREQDRLITGNTRKRGK